MNTEVLLDYVRAQQVAPQWQDFLRALAGELCAQADDSALRTLFHSIGTRLAEGVQAIYQDIDTLANLQQVLNGYWGGMQWGWVEMTEQAGFVDITHCLAPLSQAFGEDALGWSTGVLEGFYQTVFQHLGADPALQLQYVQQPGHDLALRFRFGRG
ncbi:MAG: cellulose biosynthesis protein BcsD [Rhodoferax sp.]